MLHQRNRTRSGKAQSRSSERSNGHHQTLGLLAQHLRDPRYFLREDLGGLLSREGGSLEGVQGIPTLYDRYVSVILEQDLKCWPGSLTKVLMLEMCSFPSSIYSHMHRSKPSVS